MDESPPQSIGQSPPSLPTPPLSNHTGSPTYFLKNVIGKRVIVCLPFGVDQCETYSVQLISSSLHSLACVNRDILTVI